MRAGMAAGRVGFPTECETAETEASVLSGYADKMRTDGRTSELFVIEAGPKVVANSCRGSQKGAARDGVVEGR